MKNIIAALTIVIIIVSSQTSCRKQMDAVTPPPSLKELTIIGWDSLSKYAGYINCGTAGAVDVNGVYYNFVAPSSDGAVTITYMKFHVNVNDASKPITMFSMWDNNSGQRDILVTSPDVEFKDLKTVIPEGDNGRWVGASLTYSGINRNGVTSGKTVSSVTLVEVRYKDQKNLSKTIYPNLKSADRMSVFSYIWVNASFSQTIFGLSVGSNKSYQMGLNSIGGDNLLMEIPLKLKTVDCVVGNIPTVSFAIWDSNIPNSNPGPAIPGIITRINDSLVILKLPTPYTIKKDHSVYIDFYPTVQSMTVTPNTVLITGLGNLKYFKYKEITTGVEFSSTNENYMWPGWYYYNGMLTNYQELFWELRP